MLFSPLLEAHATSALATAPTTGSSRPIRCDTPQPVLGELNATAFPLCRCAQGGPFASACGIQDGASKNPGDVWDALLSTAYGSQRLGLGEPETTPDFSGNAAGVAPPGQTATTSRKLD